MIVVGFVFCFLLSFVFCTCRTCGPRRSATAACASTGSSWALPHTVSAPMHKPKQNNKKPQKPNRRNKSLSLSARRTQNAQQTTLTLRHSDALAQIELLHVLCFARHRRAIVGHQHARAERHQTHQQRGDQRPVAPVAQRMMRTRCERTDYFTITKKNFKKKT